MKRFSKIELGEVSTATWLLKNVVDGRDRELQHNSSTRLSSQHTFATSVLWPQRWDEQQAYHDRAHIYQAHIYQAKNIDRQAKNDALVTSQNTHKQLVHLQTTTLDQVVRPTGEHQAR